MKYGQLIYDRMTSYGLPAMTPAFNKRSILATSPLDQLKHTLSITLALGVIHPKQTTPSWAHFMRTWAATQPGWGNFSSTAANASIGLNTCSRQNSISRMVRSRHRLSS